ncbi:uncharacterized protein [Argopecten irradians]|uniref:uncharacterized protein n=1 Tax=Argopecten irradians TaxID=31199 RepID=UPI0037228040
MCVYIGLYLSNVCIPWFVLIQCVYTLFCIYPMCVYLVFIMVCMYPMCVYHGLYVSNVCIPCMYRMSERGRVGDGDSISVI